MSKRTKRILGVGMALGLVALVGLLGLLMVAPAFAQENTPPTTPTPGSSQGPGLGRGWGRGFGFGGFGGSWATFDAVAEALGMTPEQLFSELHSGKTLEEIAEEKGVDIQKVYEAAQAARVQQMKDAIQQAVEDGRMTQEQADWLLEGLEKGYFPMGRGFGFGRGFRCPGWGNNSSTPTTPSSSTSSSF
ncbi:MAG: hypothetical protein H5T61_14125 [Thermoflexales bacterium]|nr:hypothetical protein [Thermoflexales bacterium]